VVLDNRAALVIDFRYHLVSIIAVFLALAVGLVVGATALSGPVIVALKKAQTTVSRENDTLLKEKKALSNQVSADQAFGGAVAPVLLPDVLAGEKVVLVVAPNASNTVTGGVTTTLHKAGATVTNVITLNPAFLDITAPNEERLQQLAQHLAQQLAGTPGVSLPAQLTGQVPGQQAAAHLLAASLLRRGDTAPSLTDSQADLILSGFSQGGFLSTSNASSLGPASLAVLVTGGTPPPGGSAVLVATAVALQNAGSGTVMAGAVGSSAVISAENNVGQVSTVDFADTEIGQIVTVYALRLLLDGQKPAQFGVGPKAAPSPAPTPSVPPTPQPSVTPSVSASTGRHK
jgi:Copper transport outer membrane protein, MctB